MRIDSTSKWLPVFEALASDVRLKIIGLLSQKPMNVKELAQQLGLSSAIVTMHVRKLEEGYIIKSERVHTARAVQKLCSLSLDTLVVDFPQKDLPERKFHEFSVPVGHYTDFEAAPTCGLATTEKVIGYFDDPRYFLAPERVNANILWFTKGFIEYKIPNHLLTNQTPEELEISLELGSEAPGVNNNWPSDISFYINNIKIGQWTSPGDFGEMRGKYTPEWWSLTVGQFGLLKVIRINKTGTHVDGTKVSDVTLDMLNILQKQWSFKIAISEDARNIGGVTLFGKGFGNYDQDIVFRLHYRQ